MATCCWALVIVKDVGEESAGAIVDERERHGPYTTPADLVRRTGLKPQAMLSLAMAGAFDGLNPNRRRGAVGGRSLRNDPPRAVRGPSQSRWTTACRTCPTSPPSRG